MNNSVSLIYLDQLQQGNELPLSCVLDPCFLELQETDEAQCIAPVSIQGTCACVDDFVVLNVGVRALFTLPCALCNERFEYEVVLDRFRHQETLQDIKSPTWDFSTVLREAILLEIPFFPQCGGKECVNKDEVKKYFTQHREAGADEEKKNTPFQDFFEKNELKLRKKK